MKFLLTILTFSAVLLCSCADEFQNINTDTNFPDTQELIDVNIGGKITTEADIPLDDITVDLLVDGNILSTTLSKNGLYSFQMVAAHKDKTIIRAHSKEYAPNFINVRISEGVENYNEDFILQKLDFTKASPSEMVINEIVNPDYNFQIKSGAFENSNANILVTADYFNYTSNIKAFMGIRTGIDPEGNPVLLNLRKFYYLGAYDLSTDEVLINSEINNTLSTPLHEDLSLWAFDISKGNWVPHNNFKIENNRKIIESDKFTYFGFVSSDCNDDEIAPIAVCKDSTEIYIDQVQTLYAVDFDSGSFDNCSENLEFKIKVLADLCQNASDNYSDSLSLCDFGNGNTITIEDYPLRMLALDENGNKDSCDFTINIFPTNCNNDITAPIPNLINNSVITLRAGKYKLQAKDLDNGSEDNCSLELIYQIKKLTDLCSNQSDRYRDYIEFCSAEVGTTVAVNVEVIDESNNVSNIDLNVIVEAPDCSMDTENPEPHCASSQIALTNGVLVLNADFLDYGSYDNCSEQLSFEIKKDEDLCQNGSDEYGSSITLCEEERGQSLFIRMRVTDENGNSSICGFSYSVLEEDCINDSKDPRLGIKTNHVHRLSYGNELTGQDLDIRSYDACSENLTWSIKKFSDLCGNGSTTAGPSISFCTEEIGKSIDVLVTISDENGNKQNKSSTIRVLE